MGPVTDIFLKPLYNHSVNHNISHSNNHSTTHDTSYDCEVTPLRTTLTIVYSCIIVLVVLLNTSIFISLKPFQCMGRRSNLEILVMYLAVFDLLASVMLISQVYQEMTCDYDLGSVGCKLVYPTFQISLNMSMCILIIMSMDRCISLWYPTSRRWFTAKTTHVVVGIAFAVSVLIQTYQFLALRQDEWGNCSRDRTQLTFGVPRIVVTVLRDLVFIFVAVITSVVTWRTLHCNSKTNDNSDNAENKRRKAHQRLAMINSMQMVFGALVIPYDIFDCFMQIVVMADININFHLIETPDIVLSVLQMSSSFVNCFVFAKMYRCLLTTPRHTAVTEDDDKVETTIEINYTYRRDLETL